MRRAWLLYVAVAALALGTRISILIKLPVTYVSESERVGAALAEGRGWSDAYVGLKEPNGIRTGPTAHLAPLYPLLISGIYCVWGDYHTVSGRLAQQCFSLIVATLVVLLIPSAARKIGFPASAGWAAAFLAAWMPENQHLEANGTHEQVVAALVLLGLVWILADLSQVGWTGRRRIVSAGLLVSVTALLCPNLLLVPALFIAVELVRGQERRTQVLKCGLLLFAMCAVAIAPWTIRNYYVLGGFVPLRSNFGLELAIGNRSGADGHTYTPGFNDMHPNVSPAERAKLMEIGELAYMKERQRQGFVWIKTHPEEFGRLTVRRAGLFWFTPNESWYILDLRLRQDARLCALIGFAVLFELFRLLRRGHPAGLLLICTLLGAGLPYFVTHVETRYRLPVTGFFALLSCNLAVATTEWVRNMFRRSSEPATTAPPAPIARAA